MSKLLAVSAGLFVVAAFLIAQAFSPAQQQPAQTQVTPPGDRLTFEPEPVRVLEPDTIAVRLLLGTNDTEVRSWDGRVTIDRGEVIGVDGWRLRQSGKVTGRDSWRASSLLIRNTETLKR